LLLLIFCNESPEPSAPLGHGSVGAQTIVLENTGDIWIRSISTGTTYENDLESVWSSASGDLRYGLIEFDLSSLESETLTSATLSIAMYSVGTTLSYPIKQKIYSIDCSGGTSLTSLSWSSYHAQYNTGKQLLATLGRYDLPPGGGGQYFDSAASAADLSIIEAAASSGDKRFSIVMIADEDGTDYRCDWEDNDGLALDLPAILTVEFLTPKAYEPNPIHQAVHVEPNAILTWIPGVGALSHNIYFGTDYDQVNNATNPLALPGRGNQLVGNESYLPDGSPLDYNAAYYWRIDEVNASGTEKGNVWTFTTKPEVHDPVSCPPGDFDNDCDTDVDDLLILLVQWMSGMDSTDFGAISQGWLDETPKLVISEFMADNDDTLATTVADVTKYPDWIEIYNPTAASISLTGWYLTDKAATLDMWAFPAGLSIDSKGYLVVFASDKADGDYPYVDDSNSLLSPAALSHRLMTSTRTASRLRSRIFLTVCTATPSVILVSRRREQ